MIRKRRKFFSAGASTQTLFFMLLYLMLLFGPQASPYPASTLAAAELRPHSSVNQLPESIQKLLGTDWYGIYFQENKIGSGSSRLLQTETRKVNGVDITYYTVLETPASGPDMTSVYGADGKSFTTSVGGAFIFRLEPEALAVKTDTPMDLFVSNFVGIDTALGDPAQVIRLKAALDDRTGSKIGEAPGQSVTLDAANGRYIVITASGQEPRIRPTAAETDHNLKATTEIPIDHPKVVDLARQAVAGSRGTGEKVARLVRFVEAYITDDYNANPLTLFDIMAKRRGDCSEHARLFTALARALAIPCREVSGLAYVGDNLRGFYPHAWNEVVLDGYWVPVDPTWGQTTIDATHIRFAVDENEMLQIMAAVPNMKIAILEFETKAEKPQEIRNGTEGR